jgi:hypothetical protein
MGYRLSKLKAQGLKPSLYAVDIGTTEQAAEKL